MAPQFSFSPRWKEELVCSSSLGSFVLELPMGVPSIYFPTPEVWPQRAPAWAAPYWTELHDQLAAWCAAHRLPLYVDATAQVFND